ncbi:MFS transporter [Sphingomonas panacisoli]|uniref:MFS transporter n=1 Tax=Sphingomonas panacisoli TaxID=1813879 RepID=A0A5B8LNN4_9SPHN|nr:MFS transporter [Sphingomonas panacisoli]QDZ09264.1 MFS transporter [Sphingomonas panacisoli]
MRRAAPLPTGGNRSLGFLLIYAIANAGGVIGFLPLLTLLLPMKIEAVVGDGRITLITATVIAGSTAAGLSNILFGWLSDRSVARGGGRRRWVAGGVVATSLSYAYIAVAPTPTAIILATIAFQAALNATLNPLYAIMADEIPDAQNGLTGGLLALANPISSAVLAVVVSMSTLSEGSRLAIVVVAFTTCIAPLLITRSQPLPIVDSPRAAVVGARRDLAFAWAARLLVQISGVILQLYLLYYFESIEASQPTGALPPNIGHLLTLSFAIALPVAVAIGRLSDRIDRRKPFLFGAAAVAALGLLGMAFAGDWTSGAISFAIYSVGAGVFLPLHNAFSIQLLPDPRHRGRDLGLLNLTNTLPSLLGPLLTWALATPSDFRLLMLVLVVLTFCGGLAILAVRGRR